MGDQSNSDKPLSILEKFRQLSKEKEQEQCQVKEVKRVESVDAVYLTNNTGDMPSSSDTKRWNSNRRSNRGGGNFFGKRKFDGDHSSSPEQKKRFMERHRRNIGQHVGLKAEDVGITEYICPYSGFTGIIKQRFSDFQVNEIAEDGEVVKLTNQVLPKDPEPDKDSVSLENDEDMLKILPKEYWDKLYSIVEDEDPQDSVDIEVTDWPKDKRIQVHSAIKNLFKEKVVSNTVDEGDKKVLKITYSKDGGYRAHRRALWRSKEYLHFIIHKENMDTTEAINVLCHKLEKRSKTIQVCGTKDKRAKTTQRAAVRRVMAERLHKIQPLRCIVLGNYEYKSYPLKLGQLKGNRFRIAIRNINATEELVSQGMNSLKTKGFINYYGLQRFGASVLVPTHIVGLALIRKDWKEAVELLLKPRPGERCYPEVAKAREIWWETKDSKKASKCFSWKSPSLEYKVLLGLNKTGPTAYLNALENLPRNLLMFYGHAYQSLIWNKVVSRRIKEFGLTPLAGDIIFLDGCDNENETDGQGVDNRSDIEDDDENENGENSKLPPDDLSIESFRNAKIKFLTEDEAKNASIEDIVYPVPGYEVQYPKNITAGWYDEFLKEDDLTQESLAETKRYSHLFSMYGAYRKIVEKPENVTWSLLNYPDENSDLLLSDFDEMNGVKPIEDVPDGKYKALLLEMNLGPCAYATMALRELMKCETSSSFQASLTAQHKTGSKKDEQNTTVDNKIRDEVDNLDEKASENGKSDEIVMKEESAE